MNTSMYTNRTISRLFALVAVFSLMGSMLPMQAFADEEVKVKICHANTNGYDSGKKEVDESSLLNESGHASHDTGGADGLGDIIPPIGAFPGQNWGDEYHMAIWNAGCETGGDVKVTKVVVGGTAIVSDFQLFVGATQVMSGVKKKDFPMGDYQITETGTPAGYVASFSGSNCNASGVITVVPGNEANCTITNTYTDVCPNIDGPQTTIPDGMTKNQAGNCVAPESATGTLSVQKIVVGGTAATSSFKFQVNEGNETYFEEDGQNDLIVEAGKTYTVTEVVPGGNYTPSYSCENLAVTEGQTTTCVITNTYKIPDEEPKICKVEIVSDTSDFVVEKDDNAKALTFIHSAWTAVIAGATWIWGDNPIVNTLVDETQTFKKQFGFVGNVTNATLYVASDNKHSAVLNSGSVNADLAENNFSDASKNTYDVTSDVDQGNNELVVSVTNIGLPDTNAASNPAGLLYKLVIEGTVTTDDDCSVSYEPPYQPENATFDGYKWNDEDGDGVWDEGENGIAGWVFEAIDGEDNVIATTSTDVNGHYSFTLDIKKGPWTIEEVNQINWNQTAILKHNDGTYKVESCQWSTNQYESSIYDAVYSCDFGNQHVGSDSEAGLSCSITASKSPIRRGDDVTLNWSSVDALSASIDNGIGAQATSGSFIVENLGADTTFTMTVYGDYVGESEVRESKTCSVLVNTISSGGGHGGRRHPTPEVLGEATSTPEVLGSQVTAVPYGAPDAGNGGTSHSSTITISQLLLAPRRLQLVK